ncbi:MAG: hypothetical protein ACR2QL_12400 [Woeseiaceae bacterium]
MVMLNRLSRLLLVILLVAAGVSSPTHAAEPLTFDGDGWHTWSVASVDEFEEERFFVLVESGEARKIHIAGRWCNGWSRKHSGRNYPEAVDLGFVETDQSIDWFEQYVGKRTELSSDALAAISQHEGSRAVQVMIDIVESDAPMNVREEAVFWMAQSGSQEAFAYIDRLLMLD